MKIMHICTKNARIVLGALAIQTLCVYLGQALAAEPVNPYQHQADVSDSSTCPSQQCIFSFTPVPQGQRLVITYVSAQVGLADTVLLENGGTTLFVPKANSSSLFLGAQVTYYVNSGETQCANLLSQYHGSYLLGRRSHWVSRS
jgi:hypothetical protein